METPKLFKLKSKVCLTNNPEKKGVVEEIYPGVTGWGKIKWEDGSVWVSIDVTMRTRKGNETIQLIN